MSSTNECPRCGGGVPNDAQRGAYPGALSRWDNITEVCSSCGQDEGLLQAFTRPPEMTPQQAVHPTMGVHKWAILVPFQHGYAEDPADAAKLSAMDRRG